MAQMYERYLRVLKKWPMFPENRVFRCLGRHIRQKGKEVFTKKGELTANIQDCEERMQCLERIADDHWLKKYPRTRKSSALGLEPQDCGVLLTTEAAGVVQKTNSSFISYYWFHIKNWISVRMQ